MKAGFVSLVGRPNAGKSTLLNYLVGQKLAIVSDKPQTTRNRIVGVKQVAGPPGGAPAGQIVFVDTPGVHKPLHRLNVRMVDTAISTFGEVDVIAVVIDASEASGGGDRYLLDLVQKSKTPRVLVLNKIDLVAKNALLPRLAEFEKEGFEELVPVSAKTGDNIERLEQVLLARLPEGDAIYPEDYLTDQPERALVTEIVREKVLQHTHAELPFSSAVAIDEFDESDRERLLRLYCTIYVEQESQKPIVIGRGGEMIKRIGTEARQDLERFFDTKVFLDLRVKVNPDWRNNERALDELGVPRTARRPARKRG
jgi:GTP-binding protein Era